MLKELYIKNVAVIEEVRVSFEEGFNVLTGETGAGKSILIDSINMAIGNRTSKDLVRSGCDKAVVSVCFSANDRINSFLEENGIEVDEENVILSRQLTKDAKSTSRINGMTVTGSILKEAGKLLIDIHGQNDNYFLLSNKYHMDCLDDYAKLKNDKEDYLEKYQELCQLQTKIKELSENALDRENRIELLKFQLEEIDAAKLKKGESEEIESRITYLSNIEKIVSGAGDAHEALYSADSNAYDCLKNAIKNINSAKEYDNALYEAADRLESALIEIEDVASELGSYIGKTDFDEKEFDHLQTRLDIINSLKRKYGSTEEDILTYRDKISSDLTELESGDEILDEIKKQEKELKGITLSLAEALHQKRTDASENLSNEIKIALTELDMPKVTFKADVKEKYDSDGEKLLSSKGFDEVEFLISANPGEALKPISKIASGGELSRIMLALKSIFADSDIAETLIFDEIDTGVSGRAAQKIAEKISRLSRKKQIFSITHLAQIASMADYHYLIKKTTEDKTTYTNLTLLEGEERTSELARIIGGAYITDLTLKNAEEMLTLAEEVKNRL